MRRSVTFLFTLSLLVSACDDLGDLETMDSSVLPGPATPGAVAAGGTTGASGTASGAASPGGAASPAGAAVPGGVAGGTGSTGRPAGTMGVQDAGVTTPGGGALPGLPGGASDAGPLRDGGQTMTGGTQGGTGGGTMGAGGPGPNVAGPAPVLPKSSMPCPAFTSGTTMFNGLSVEVYAGPKSTGKKGPLVFHWHGTGGNGKQATMGLGADGAGIPAEMMAEIMAEGGIVISPTDNDSVREGSDVTFLLAVWYTPGDFKLADHFAACAVEQHNIDPRRIYTTGCSAGGLMAGVMTFHRSSYIAASVPNSGGVVSILPGMTTFQDSHVPALMTMHGDRAQDEVIVNFEDTSVDADNAVLAKGGLVVNCNHGGGHCGAPKALKLAMWQFMKDHPFGVSPEPYANGLPASFPSYCKLLKR